ncbi:MAG: hypothetical protein ACD_8C00138G0001 [uncultured bacterium]|nr:MAG: hypothetical protein ACD_8C00138G0001 [uncultured bacterium]
MPETSKDNMEGMYEKVLTHLTDSIAVTETTTRALQRKMEALATLFRIDALRMIVLPDNSLYCLPRKRRSESNIDPDHYHARIATDKKRPLSNKHFVIIEEVKEKESGEKKGMNWKLKQLIPVEKITGIKVARVNGQSETFDVHLVIPEMEDLKTPEKISF